MRTATGSWRISVDEPRQLVIALFLRDTFGLAAPGGPPPLDPGVASRDLDADRPLLGAEWAEWWDRLVWTPPAYPPALVSLAGPHLGALVRAHHAAATAWCEQRKREYVALMPDRHSTAVEWDLVRAAGKRLGRRVRPFNLQISEVPVAGLYGTRLAPHHLLVSRGLFADPDMYRAFLEPIVDELA